MKTPRMPATYCAPSPRARREREHAKRKAVREMLKRDKMPSVCVAHLVIIYYDGPDCPCCLLMNELGLAETPTRRHLPAEI